MKILANFSDWNHTKERAELNTYGAIGYYRLIKPVTALKNHEVTIVGKEITDFGKTLEEQWDNIFKEYDVFWTNYFSDDKVAGAIFYHAQKYNKKVIIDVDDNYLDVPPSNELYEKFKSGKRDRAMLSTILSFADAITVSTYPLKERLDEHFKSVQGVEKKIYVIPNMNDYKFWETVDKNDELIRPELPEGSIVIGYSGSNSHKDDLKMVMPAIAKLMKKHSNLYFQLIGSIDKKYIREYFDGFRKKDLDRVTLLPAESILNRYPSWLRSQKWDIGIAPLVDTAFTRSKSHIKWMEYSMFKIPTVASRVYPYFMPIRNKQTIKEGETGLLCTPKEWEGKLERLILDKDLREKLGNQAYEFIKKEWQYDEEFSGKVEKILSEL